MASSSGRWQARNEPDGGVVLPAQFRPLQPSRLASLGTLPYTGRARNMRRSMSFRNEAQPIEESPRFLSLARGSLHSTAFRVRDDMREGATPPSPPLCKGVSRALCAPPQCGVRARRTEVFAIVGKNRDRGGVPLAPPRPWRAIEKSRRKGCPARAIPTVTTLPPRSARHPPLHREGKKR